MPRLLIFAPCEKVIIGQGDNVVSMIGILEEFTITLAELPAKNGAQEKAEPLENAKIANQWSVLTLWSMLPGEEGKRFQQRVELIDPRGKAILAAIADFTLEKRRHRIHGQVQGFPVGLVGDYLLRLSLREINEREWREIATYPIEVLHKKVTPTASLPRM